MIEPKLMDETVIEDWRRACEVEELSWSAGHMATILAHVVALADQLAAARAEIERLTTDSKTAWEQADILADGLEQACAALVADRGADALRSKLRRLYRDAYRAARDKAGR